MTRRAVLLFAIVGTAAVVAWLWLAFESDLAAHRARVAGGSRIVDTRCGPVEISEAGPASATPPLLLVHGTGGGFDQGIAAAPDFVARGLRVIAPSRFGYLRTPFPSDASAEAQADQFACLLDALGIDRVAIMGVSAGANSAMQFAIRHPQRTQALILLVPAAYKPPDAAASAPPPSPAQEAALMTLVGSDFPFWFAQRFLHDTAVRWVLATPVEDYAQAPADERTRADAVLRQILPISARAQGMRSDARLAAHPPRYALEAIRAPTLIISARNDGFGTWASAQYSAQHIAGARFLGFERGGHLWLGHQNEVVEQTAAFIIKAGAPR